MANLNIRLKRGRAKAFKKHLEKEHPSTRGKITISKGPRINLVKKTNKAIKEMVDNVPDWEKQAAEVTRI